MSILHILTRAEIKQLSQIDRTYLKRKLSEHCMLNRILHKPINQCLLYELQCLLDKQPLPRQKSGQFVRGQMSRLTDGIRRPCVVRKMTAEELVRYGVVARGGSNAN